MFQRSIPYTNIMIIIIDNEARIYPITKLPRLIPIFLSKFISKKFSQRTKKTKKTNEKTSIYFLVKKYALFIHRNKITRVREFKDFIVFLLILSTLCLNICQKRTKEMHCITLDEQYSFCQLQIDNIAQKMPLLRFRERRRKYIKPTRNLRKRELFYEYNIRLLIKTACLKGTIQQHTLKHSKSFT